MEDSRQDRVPPPALTVKSDVKELNSAEVTAIVEDALADWLPGYTDYDEKKNSQWKISFLGNDRYRFEQLDRTTRVFKVHIVVVEEK